MERLTVRKLVPLVALAAILAALTASNTLGALINGALPSAGFIHTSVMDNSVSILGGPVTASDISALQAYITELSAVRNPTTAQRTRLATYVARLAAYEARYAAAIDLRASRSVNVKMTYSRVPPSASYEAGWHIHDGPVVVTVTVGTLTLVDSECNSVDVGAGHSYVESPGEVLNARALPAKNAGVQDVEWFTTRLYPSGAIDPVPVAAPCTS